MALAKWIAASGDENVANVAAVFDLVAQKFCIRELNALQKEAII